MKSPVQITFLTAIKVKLDRNFNIEPVPNIVILCKSLKDADYMYDHFRSYPLPPLPLGRLPPSASRLRAPHAP